MEGQNEETLNELYAIRAAMSLVAANDEMNARRERAILSKTIRRNELPNLLRREEDELTAKLTALKCDVVLKTCRFKIAHAEQELEHVGLGKAILSAVCAFFSALLGAGIMAVFAIQYLFAESLAVFSVAAILVFAVSLFCAACFFVGTFNGKKYRAAKDEIRSAKEEAVRVSALGKEGRVYVDEAKAESLKENFETFRAEQAQTEDRLKREIFQLDRAMEEAKEFSRAVVSAAEESYELSLPEWGKIDLLIHFVKTKKAGTMSEALALAERPMRAERLAKLLDAAAKERCRSFPPDGKLEHAAMERLARLSAHIDSVYASGASAEALAGALIAKISLAGSELFARVLSQID